jgi:hypothetical protein
VPASGCFTRGASVRADESDRDLPGPRPEFFFTATHIVARRQAWGSDTLRRRLADAWMALLACLAPRLRIEAHSERDEVEWVYRDVLEGRTSPDRANVLSFDATASTLRCEQALRVV